MDFKNKIFSLSFDNQSLRNAHRYTQEELYELYLMSRASNSIARMIADIPVYQEIDMAAIPYVQVLLTECIKKYFADLDVTHQGVEKPEGPYIGPSYLTPEQCKGKAKRKIDKRMEEDEE